MKNNCDIMKILGVVSLLLITVSQEGKIIGALQPMVTESSSQPDKTFLT